MTRPVDPYVVRRLADCIELLPRYINNPQKMPFVQEVVQRALEEINSASEALARGHELGGDLRKAEKYRKPVTSVWLSDSDEQALKDGFEEDETGIFELFEHWAAEIGEWIKECRCPRDAERFRTLFSSVCGEALFHPVKGVEVSPGVYKLDLSSWKADAAKPLCDYLRELADEMATEGNASDPPKLEPVDGEGKQGKQSQEQVAALLETIKAALLDEMSSKRTVLDRTSGVLTVNGTPLARLEGADKYVLTLLVEKGAASFGDLKTAHDRPDKVLKALRTKYPALKKYIRLPGGPGRGGYSTTIVLEE